MTKSQLETNGGLAAIFRHNVRLDKIVYVPIDQIKGYSRDLRRRSDAGREALKNSVSCFGIVAPILIDQHDVIIAGAGIVEAARAVGYTEVPTVRIDHLGDGEVRLLRLALNKLTETSTWNDPELAVEFIELLSLDLTLDYEVTGFNTIEIDNVIHAPASRDVDDPDDEQMPIGDFGSEVTRLGDLWDLGDHQALCGSSLDEANLTLLMAGDVARMVLVDQPYNVPISGHVSGLGKHQHREFAQASGEMSEEEFTAFLTQSIKVLAACCHDGSLVYLYMDWRHQWEMLTALRAAGLTMLNLAVWVKRSGSMGAFYRSQHELCFIAKKGAAPHRNNVQLGRYGRNRTNCWFYPGVNTFSAERDELLAMHPTCKNVSMLSDAIRDATHRGEIVLDGFLGSGSTLIAAERTARRCYGVELDPRYVDTIVRRWEKATGNLATLRDTGETFAETAARRAAEVARPEIVIQPRKRVRA